MATAINRPPSTVNSWKARQSIPDHVKPLIMKCANERGIDLNPSDFFPDINHSEAS